MKATQLDQMNADYDQVKKSKELTHQIIRFKEVAIPKMKNEVKEWENKFKSFTAISDLKDKVKLLSNEMAWALVGEKEKVLKQQEKTLNTEKAALSKFTGKVEGAKENVKLMEEHHKGVEEKLIVSGSEVETMKVQLKQKERDLNVAKETVAPIMAKFRMCDRELRSTKQECQQCQERIEELKTLASHDFEASRREREEKIASLEGKVEELNNKQTVKEHEIDQHRNAVVKYKSDIAGLDSQLRNKQNKLRETKSALQNLQSAQHNYLQRFGQWIPGIVEKIKAAKNKFHKLPRGPLGAHFTLKDQKWALPIECCLKSLITAFVVHDSHDERLLEEIFSVSNCQRNRRPPIIRCAFSDHVHDVKNHRARHPNYPCILDVLQSKDSVIINTLIDQRSIENVLLIEDSNDARNVMMRNPPRNARECFTITGDQAFCLPTFRYYSSDKTSVRYLMADVDEQISNLKNEMKFLDQTMKELMQQKDNLNKQIHVNQSEERKCQTQLNKLVESINRLKFEVTELQNVEDPAPVDVTTLEGEVESYKEKIKELLDKKAKINEDHQDANEVLQTAKDNFSKMEADIRERSDSVIPLREEIRLAQNKVDIAKNELRHYTGKLKEQENRIQGLSREVDGLRPNFESDKNKALELSEPIATRRNASNIESEITQIQRRILEEEEHQGNEFEITETFYEKKNSLKRVVKEVSQLKNYIEKLDEVMATRHQAYHQMREQIACRTKHHFAAQIFHRSYAGRLNFNFENQTLDIEVTTSQERQRGSETQDLKSLSGGERSFSTVCFILSLWEAMESPFRCLDEFDVFMDMVNRRISMDMMMETADMHKNLQFIFLTPQHMSSVRNIDNVKIFRMPDPERPEGQKTLNFSPS